ncbi:hypothetical protein J6T66_06295 [bacterium]|nr:hypothetical protein [bacterium]
MKELKKAYPVYISKKLSSRVVSNLSPTSSDNEDPELKIFTKIKDEFISKYKVEVSEDVIDVVLLCYKHNDMATAFQNAVKLSNYKPLFNSLLEGNGETLSDDELIKLGEYLFIR